MQMPAHSPTDTTAASTLTPLQSTSAQDAHAAFTAFYEQGARSIYLQVYSLTRSSAEAQDCVHDAYVKAWQHWAHVCQQPDPQAWVRRVAYRQAISRWRKARNRVRAHLRHGPAEPTPALSPDAVALEQALEHLPDKQRQVVVLHYLSDLSIAQVAHLLEIPEGTVKTRLSKARELLRGALAEAEQDARYTTRPTPPGHPPAAPPPTPARPAAPEAN